MASRSSAGRTGITFFVAAVFFTHSALAQTAPPPIPTQPSAPPTLGKRAPEDAFRCQRKFTYQGRILPCDSNLMQDGEQLRPIISDVPAAVAELDAYQATRRRVEAMAYVGTAGLLLAAVGAVVSRQFEHPTSQTIRNVSVGTGLLALGFAVVYGFTTLNDNEERLGNAVKAHNEAHPDRPLELQFSTSF